DALPISDQFATEFAELGHGIFTYALLEALSGKAADATGQITNNGIKSYIDNRIPELSRIHRGSEQYPTTFSFGQDYPIGLK
ncbi:MAG: caspase, partial [Candidatus Cloacimonetes bacterium]|nr:caspase [Candidatus Cloacimonadota bacterium]